MHSQFVSAKCRKLKCDLVPILGSLTTWNEELLKIYCSASINNIGKKHANLENYRICKIQRHLTMKGQIGLGTVADLQEEPELEQLQSLDKNLMKTTQYRE